MFCLRFLHAISACLSLLAVSTCTRTADPRSRGSTAERLRPLTTPPQQAWTVRTVYVPIYSSIYWGIDIKKNIVDLAATVSIRNVSTRHPLILNFVRYYDSAGKLVRKYVTAPSELAPMSTVEFVIQQRDTAGGPGASFLIEWTGAASMNEPILEAVMVGQSGNAGISFTSSGRVLKHEP